MYITYRSNRIFRILLLSLIAVGVAACQGKNVYKAYEGDPKPASEIASVRIPVELRLEYVDDQPNKGVWFLDTTTIQTLPGKHRFIFYYEIFWEVSSSDAVKVKSQSFALTFDTKAGDVIAIEPPAINSLEDAQAFAKNPQFTLTNKTTDEPVAFEQTTRLEDKGYVASFVESVSKEQGSLAESTAATTGTGTAPQSREALDKLKHWWESAGAKERQDFMASVYQQKPVAREDASTSTNVPENVTEQEPDGDALAKLNFWWGKADASQRQTFMQWVYNQ